MAAFAMHFLFCNVWICAILGIFLIAKRLFQNSLSSRMHYHLWLLLLGLLAVPLIPFRLVEFPRIFLWLSNLKNFFASNTKTTIESTLMTDLTKTTNWMNDFTLSVNSKTPAVTGYVLFGIWITGILVMILLIINSSFHLHILKKSALPLQSSEIRKLYQHCLKELNITKNISIRSTAFLKSPIIVGFFRPCIYLPIHLISDYVSTGELRPIRFMLLHELQHYKHKDLLSNYLMNFAGVIYWFNPFIWYALKQMRSEREIACDTSVLQMLEESSYEDYGNTLIDLAEKISLTPFPFATGFGKNKRQIEQRIINIASYEKPTLIKKYKGILISMLIAVLLLGSVPFLSANAAEMNYYPWNASGEQISYIDLSAYFGTYEGSFVLYDLGNDCWNIYNMERALFRVAPNSTYKIY
ncbi:MAG: BlaR1 family beta-lactam sensor/signal transducer, partial [Lachnospiraceae bacterium]|nr:BlaR1 family beta-lactam sensor/signal transducer [Lachnospiraceae bacterium]